MFSYAINERVNHLFCFFPEDGGLVMMDKVMAPGRFYWMYSVCFFFLYQTVEVW
jgi:hypothetical protein